MHVKEILFTKREIKNGGVFLHIKNNEKEKIGIVLVKMSEDWMYPLDGESPLIECRNDDGTSRPPDQRTIDYHVDKIHKIASEQYIGEEVNVYVARIKGDPNIIGFLAHPDELGK